ncbi:MAG: histidine phosphatase family protein [Ardenticatenia bacterium]|nr:MAG: histidine phosphatase family protein [Ardenticatenia bacterium]
MTTIYMVRHGETDWNVIGRYQGQEDPPLNARGRAQAEATAEQLAQEQITAIYSSDLKRAAQTAEALAQRLNLPVHLDPRLREINQGEWQGVLVDDIRAHWPERFQQWQTAPWETHPPGGETLHDVETRILAALADIATRHPNERVAVFTHKLPIALMRIRLKGAPREALWSLLPKNAAWDVFDVSADELHHLLAQLTTPRAP